MARLAAASTQILLAGALVAGCAATPTVTDAPASHQASPAGTLPPASEPVSPTATSQSLAPTASTAACQGGPIGPVASVEDLADPSCYGTAELTVEGWLAETDVFVPPGQTDPSWTIPWVGLFARNPRVSEYAFDFLWSDRTAASVISVVTPSDSGVDISGIGRWASITGHFNDPAASTCRVVSADDDDENEPECERLFVVTAVQPLDRQAPPCPTESPLSLEAYLAAEATCFAGRDAIVAAWEDRGEGFGGFAPVFPTSAPPFHVAPAQLWSAPFGTDQSTGVFVWLVDASGVTFERTARPVTVTARLGDGASRECVPGPYPAWSWSPPLEWAQHRCERLIVIADVSDRG